MIWMTDNQAALTQDVRAWYSRIGTGWRVFPRWKRVLIGQSTAARGWALRRLRYGAKGHSGKGRPGNIPKDSAIAWSGNGNPSEQSPTTKPQ